MSALRWTIAAGVVAAALWVSTGLLVEAYGSGSPHYGRTTNMDKWTSPWLSLALINGTALALALVVTPGSGLRLGRKRKRL
jgi:hypothetical protein